jgi:hypothetical protein
MDDLRAYLGIEAGGPNDERRAAAEQALQKLLELAEAAKDLLAESDVAARFPFGVAYFALLKAWLDGRLDDAALEGTVREQAYRWTAASLRTLRREPRWEKIARSLLD